MNLGSGQGRQFAGLLVVGDHGQAPGVTRLAGERGGDEDPSEADRVVKGVHPRAEAEHVGVVVLPRQLGGLVRPGHRGTDAWDLVRSDLLAVTRAPDHDAEAARVAGHPVSRADDVRRVVVVRGIRFRTTVDRLMTGFGQPLDKAGLPPETCVIRSQVYAHRASLPDLGAQPPVGPGAGPAKREWLSWQFLKGDMPPARRAARPDQSKMGSRVRDRFSSKKPSYPAISSTPSQSLAAASPRGIGDITGPNTDIPFTEMTGVPTS